MWKWKQPRPLSFSSANLLSSSLWLEPRKVQLKTRLLQETLPALSELPQLASFL